MDSIEGNAPIIKNEQNSSISKTGNPNKSLRIVFGVLLSLIIIIGTINIVVFFTKNKPNTPEPYESNNYSDIPSENLDDTTFEDLTKEQALAAIYTMLKSDYMPEGFADQKLKTESLFYNLIDSYASTESLEELRKEKYPNHIIDYVQDYYAILHANPEQDSCNYTCDETYISFNNKYIDVKRDGNLNIAFLNKEKDFIKTALPVLSISFNTLYSKLHSIYSFEFIEETDSITLVNHIIGVGLDAEKLSTMQVESFNGDGSNIPYAINLMDYQLSVDMETGKCSPKTNSDGSYLTNIKSFSLTNEEVMKLSEAGYFGDV
jgi:hypothetical protein